MRVALVEDDEHQAELIKLWMLEAGHECQTFAHGKEFIKAIGNDSYDLLVVDWMLPDIGGDQVLVWVREHIDWPIPVLFITQRDNEEDIVYALEKGADDYMTKPIKRSETTARINALLRRALPETTENPVFNCSPFEFDINNQQVKVRQ